MVKIAPFAVEQWMDEHEQTAKYNIAETCAASISIDDLIELSENKEETKQALATSSRKLTYGAIRGSDALRQNLAARYGARSGGLTKEDILITNGAIAANYLVIYSLISAGDHVVCQYPTYEQLYQVPASFGAEVSLWKMDPSKKWALDIQDLKDMVKDNTKLIILNNPNNPSGAILSKPLLEDIIEFAESKNIAILCDEVYRPLFHSISPSDDNFPPSMINMGYRNVVVTGSFSKAYSLAGIRTGWIVTKNKDYLESIADKRHYTTISVSQLDEAIAAEVMSDRCIHALLARNIQLARANLELLQNFIDEHNWACSWVKPVAGTTAMIKFHKMGKPVDDEKFCSLLQEKVGILFVPACKCFGRGEDFRGYVRVGFVPETQVLKEGLSALTSFMEDEYENVPIAPKK